MFSGAISQDLMHYIFLSLGEQKTDIAVIHIGGNDINFKNAENLNVDTLTENLGNIRKQCR